MRIIKTPEQKMLEQRLEMEKIADQFEQQEKYKQQAQSGSWDWMSGLDSIDIVELASEMMETVGVFYLKQTMGQQWTSPPFFKGRSGGIFKLPPTHLPLLAPIQIK